MSFSFRKQFEFEVSGDKLLCRVPKGMKAFCEMFKDKYKEILDLDLEAEEISETPKENKK